MDGWHLLYVHLSEFDAKSGHISKCNVTPPPFTSFQMVLIVSEFNSKWKMTTLTHIALDLLERLDEARRIGSLAQKLHLHNHTNAGWGQWYSLKGPERLCWSLSNEAIRDTCPSGQVVCFRKEEHCMIAEKCVCQSICVLQRRVWAHFLGGKGMKLSLAQYSKVRKLKVYLCTLFNLKCYILVAFQQVLP